MRSPNRFASVVRAAGIMGAALLAPAIVLAQAAEPRVAANDSEVQVKPGDVVTWANKDKIQNLIPPMYWQYFAWEGMEVKVAATRVYELDKSYMDMTEKNAGQVRIGIRGELVGYNGGGFPFPPSLLKSDDPQLGIKVAWNFNSRWMGSGLTIPTTRIPFYDKNNSRFREMTAYYRRTYFSDRMDDINREKLVAGDDTDAEWKEYFVIWAPFDVKDTEYVIVRYNDPDRADEAWAYLPTLRRVRKVPASQRSDSLLGTEHTMDDFYGSNAKIATMTWKYIGEGRVLAVVNTKKYPFPSRQEYTHGPSGVSLANGDEFEVRRVHIIERIPKDPSHPYSRQRLYLDAETFFIFYSETWDRKGEAYKFWALQHSYTAEDPTLDQSKASLKKSLLLKSLIVGNLQTGKRQIMEWGTANYDMVAPEQAEKEFAVSRLKEGR